MGDGWMPWGQKPKKGAAHGDTAPGSGEHAEIRRYPNGATHLPAKGRYLAGDRQEASGGTETS